MANPKEAAPASVEWRVTAPTGATVISEPGPWRWIIGSMVAIWSKALWFAKNAWRMGVDDPRKVIHGLKVGLALSMVSLFYYTRPLYDGVGGTAMWAVMTVVVIFEFTVGGCLYKGFNRAAATMSAGFLAIGVHWVASKSGKEAEPVLLSGSVFILASAATFSRFFPTIKAKFDYGVTIFILTFSLVAVSGYRVDELLKLAEERATTILIGISICLFVCILVSPVWAGEDLHNLIVRNMEKIANSLEGCTEDYFENASIIIDDGEESLPPPMRSQSYKCVLNSKGSEDSLANLASWEPAHGCFSFRHPWSQYLEVGASIRYTAYCIEALNGCINSEIEVPQYVKKHLSDSCTRLSSDSSRVLKESASSIKSMKRSGCMDLLVCEMNDAVQELRGALRTLPTYQFSDVALAPLMESLPLITITSLLIEISLRVKGVVDAVERLADRAEFKPADEGKETTKDIQELV